MGFLGIGLLLLLLKWLEVAPVAGWGWWLIALPFGLAAVWWTWADWSGHTKRQAEARTQRRKEKRHARNRERLGISQRRR